MKQVEEDRVDFFLLVVLVLAVF